MKEGKKKLIELIFILALLANSINANMVEAEPVVGDKTSGAIRDETKFVNHLGHSISSVSSGTLFVEMVELDSVSGTYSILVSTVTRAYSSFDIYNGEWTKYSISDYIIESGDYKEIVDDGAYSDLIPSSSSPLVNSIGRIYIPFPNNYVYFVLNPEEYLNQFKLETENIFSSFSPVDWEKQYTDRNGTLKTIMGTALLTQSSVAITGLKLELQFEIPKALDSNLFYRGIDNKPSELSFSYKQTIEYATSGLIKAYRTETVFDAGSNGKVTYIMSFGGSAGNPLLTPGLSWLLGVIVISTIIILRKSRRK